MGGNGVMGNGCIAGANGHGASGRDIAYLSISVNHAVTDAASIVPLVVDLLELHRVARESMPCAGQDVSSSGLAESQVKTVAVLAAAALPPPLDGLKLQSDRLIGGFQAFPTGDDSAVVGKTPGVMPGIEGALDLAHNAFHPRRKGYDHYIKLQKGACRILDAAARLLGAPTDHLLVAALAVAFGQISGRPTVKLSLIVPMRDARGENQAVANLATTRHLCLWVGGGRSLAAAAMDLSTRLRRREWEFCDILGDDGDRFFVNVRGIPRFEGASPVMEAVDTTRRPTRFVRNVIEMFADQETSESWTLWMGIHEDLDGSAFAQALRRVLWSLVVEPLEAAVRVEPTSMATSA